MNHPRHARGNPEKPSPSPLERQYESTRVTTGCFDAFNESRRTCFTLAASARGRRNPGDCLSSSRQTGYVEAPHKIPTDTTGTIASMIQFRTERQQQSTPLQRSTTSKTNRLGCAQHLTANPGAPQQLYRQSGTPLLEERVRQHDPHDPHDPHDSSRASVVSDKNQNAAHASIRSPHLPSLPFNMIFSFRLALRVYHVGRARESARRQARGHFSQKNTPGSLV